MTNAIADAIRIAADAAATNPYVAGGMILSGVLIATGAWIRNRRKDRKAQPVTPELDPGKRVITIHRK